MPCDGLSSYYMHMLTSVNKRRQTVRRSPAFFLIHHHLQYLAYSQQTSIVYGKVYLHILCTISPAKPYTAECICRHFTQLLFMQKRMQAGNAVCILHRLLHAKTHASGKCCMHPASFTPCKTACKQEVLYASCTVLLHAKTHASGKCCMHLTPFTPCKNTCKWKVLYASCTVYSMQNRTQK